MLWRSWFLFFWYLLQDRCRHSGSLIRRIHWRDRMWHIWYNLWFDSIDCPLANHRECRGLWFDRQHYLEVSNYFNTSTPIKLAGIAIAMWTHQDPLCGYLWSKNGDGGAYHVDDTTFDNWEEYLRLYQWRTADWWWLRRMATMLLTRHAAWRSSLFGMIGLTLIYIILTQHRLGVASCPSMRPFSRNR